MDAEDGIGPLRVKVIGRDEADAEFLVKFYRFVVYKEAGPRLFLTRLAARSSTRRTSRCSHASAGCASLGSWSPGRAGRVRRCS